MPNSKSQAGTEVQQSNEAELTTSSSHNAKPLVSRSVKILMTAGLIFVGLLASIGIMNVTNIKEFWLIADMLTVFFIRIAIKLIWDYCG